MMASRTRSCSPDNRPGDLPGDPVVEQTPRDAFESFESEPEAEADPVPEPPATALEARRAEGDGRIPELNREDLAAMSQEELNALEQRMTVRAQRVAQERRVIEMYASTARNQPRTSHCPEIASESWS